ncbi:hypothetical protein JCM3263A_13960 [Thermobifida fusca]
MTSRKRPCCLLRMTLPNSLCRIACATILGPRGSEHGTVRHVARQDSPVGSSDGQGAEARLRDMKIYQSELRTLEGEPFRLPQTQLLLIVNVASKCGLTPQYSGLERLQEAYAYRGFSVIGVPCNQFGGQEPGDAQEIRLFCATTYGISFPILEKMEVNGPNRHPLYVELTKARDSQGLAGDVQWNFEKFLVAPGGRVLYRFRPQVEPEDPEIIRAIEENLPN